MTYNGLPYEVKKENKFTEQFDAIIYVTDSLKDHPSLVTINSTITGASEIDKEISKSGAVLKIDLPIKRLVYIPVNINKEYDDVRSFGESSKQAVLRALKAGSRSPLFILPTSEEFSHCKLVSLLGAFEALYVNLQYREDRPEVHPKVEKIGIYEIDNKFDVESIIKTAVILESGRWIARDIGGTDPERMSPINMEKYVKENLTNASLSIEVIDDREVFEKEFPLFAAVDRAASVIPRHKGRIIIVTYEADNPKETLYLVGKGVTYDTGGADIKAGGVMAGMSYDKCGAAAVAGFMKVISEFKPANVKAVGILCAVRNSVGEESYVSDEMIVARSGARVRIGNTDAEGRTIMADLLCYAKERALESVNPHLLTIATLTGHACLAVGEGYSIIMDNGPARNEDNAAKFSKYSHEIGDPFEISTIRREDYKFHSGKVPGEDVLQADNQPSVRTARGHQSPAAFMVIASGLDKHGIGSEHPIKYSHIDMAGSSGRMPQGATGSPVLTLFARYLTNYFGVTSDN